MLGLGRLACAAAWPIVLPMSASDDLARRFLALWADYLAAILADPQGVERWLLLAKAGLPAAPSDDAAPAASPGSQPSAAAAAGAPGERDAAVAELARRVAELAERVAELERARRRPAGGARRRNRTVRG
jgi:hypothetical protein